MRNGIVRSKDDRTSSHSRQHKERQTSREIQGKLNVHDIPPARGPQLSASSAEKETYISGDTIYEASAFDAAMGGKSDGGAAGLDVAQVRERRRAK